MPKYSNNATIFNYTREQQMSLIYGKLLLILLKVKDERKRWKYFVMNITFIV